MRTVGYGQEKPQPTRHYADEDNLGDPQELLARLAEAGAGAVLAREQLKAALAYALEMTAGGERGHG